MTIEEAIKTAISFEKKVHATYVGAAKRAADSIASCFDGRTGVV